MECNRLKSLWTIVTGLRCWQTSLMLSTLLHKLVCNSKCLCRFLNWQEFTTAICPYCIMPADVMVIDPFRHIYFQVTVWIATISRHAMFGCWSSLFPSEILFCICFSVSSIHTIWYLGFFPCLVEFRTNGTIKYVTTPCLHTCPKTSQHAQFWTFGVESKLAGSLAG